MNKQIIISTKEAQSNRRLSAFFRDQGFVPHIIDRNQIIPGAQLVITEKTVTWGQHDLLEHTRFALILDSGYMWPQPYIRPSPDEWNYYRNNLDEYLRNEREAASFWNSFLDILNSRVPVCLNPQAGFEAAAFKPCSFAGLCRLGIPLPPYLVTNDYTRVEEFAGQYSLLYRPALSEGSRGGWCTREEALASVKEQTPLFLQGLTAQDEVVIRALNGRVLHTVPEGFAADSLPVKSIQEALHLPLAELHFRCHDSWVLSDFSAAPSLDILPAAAFDAFCTCLLELGDTG